jgi:lipopolysaccharide export system permease protein
MQIIDRYLLGSFLRTFLICFCSLTGLYIVIDGFSNLDDFMLYAEKHGSLLSVMGEYYAYRSMSFFDRTSGILTLIAAMFTVTSFQSHQELTALEAAGLSKGRVVKPVIIAVAVIAVLAALNRELVIPRVRGHLSHNAQNLNGRKAQTLHPRYDNETDVLFGGAETSAETQSIIAPNFFLLRPLDKYGKHLIAAKALYKPPEGDRPGGYLFEDVEQPKKLDRSPSLDQKGKRVIFTPYDTPWLKPGQCFVASGVSFEQLEGGTAWRQYSSLAELISGLCNRSLEFGADVRVAIHSRLVQPLLDVTLLFLGLPLVLSRKNRNMFLAIGLSVVLVVWFMGVVLVCQYLGSNMYLTANTSFWAWLPLMIFVPWAVFVTEPLRE